MKHKINKVLLSILIVTILLFSYACADHDKKGTSSDQTATTDSTLDEHKEENTVILTDEQIRTVGIEFGTIEQKQISGTMRANGILRVPNNHKANATSLFGGVIKVLNVEIGDYVKKGQGIATISNPEFIVLQEEYLSIHSNILFAEQEQTRQKELNEGNVGAKRNLQSAIAKLNTLKTRKASLKRQIEMMGINPNTLSNSNLEASLTVTSPISGTVSNVLAKIGSYVDVSSPIAEIVENSSLHLDLQVFEKDVPLIKVGQKIDFVLTNNPDKSYVAEVYNIGSSFNSSSKTIAIHSEVIGDKVGLIDGMNITGAISLGGILSLAVPKDAIVNADGKYYIFLVKSKEDGERAEQGPHTETRFEKLEVIKGATELGFTAITPIDEIKQDSPIVTKGAFFVHAKLSNAGDDHAH